MNQYYIKSRWQKQFVPEEEAQGLEKEANKVELVTTIVVPSIEVLVIGIFYIAGTYA